MNILNMTKMYYLAILVYCKKKIQTTISLIYININLSVTTREHLVPN